MNDKVQKVKKHLKDHKVAYIIGTSVGLVVGASAGIGIACSSPQLVQLVDVGNLKYKSPTTSILNTVVVRNDRVGYFTYWEEAARLFESQAAAARAASEAGFQVSAHDVSRNLNGKQDHAGGQHFKRATT